MTTNATPDDLLAVADRVLGWTNDDEQVEVVVVRGSETEVRAYNGDVESLSNAVSQGVGIRVVRDQRQGFAYAGTMDEAVLAETLRDARDNASFGSPDEFFGLASPDGVAPAELALFDDTLVSYSTAAKVELAIALEAATLAADKRISGIESAEYVDATSESAVVNTNGVRSTSRETNCYLSAYALATEGDETQTGFGFSVGRNPGELVVDVAAAEAAHRATRLLGAKKAPTDRVTVVFDPFVTAQFLSIIGSTLSGEMVLKGRSLFADRLGENVASPLISLVDDPTNPLAFTATETDGEGLATRRNALIDNGQLSMFLHNTYSGKRAGMGSTGSAVRGYSSTPSVGCMALALVPGTQSQDELIASIDNGLLVQGVAGLHSGVNPVSGDFSTGASGLRIRNGATAEPIREVTIASTLQRMLQDVQAVGSDLEWLPMSAAGVSLVVADVTMSGS